MLTAAKPQFKRADASGARFAVVVGADEVSRGVLTIRDLTTSTQEEVAVSAHFEISKERSGWFRSAVVARSGEIVAAYETHQHRFGDSAGGEAR